MRNKVDNPRLFGIIHSNRDFSKKETWGKNQFNSSFPASLTCYLYKMGLNAKYLKINSRFEIDNSEISIDHLFNIDPLGNGTYYQFETQYTPFQKYIIGSIPRNDLVIQDEKGNCCSSLEVKLTTLPDNATCDCSDSNYGSEIVVRPDTIVYLACSIADIYDKRKEELKNELGDWHTNITDWTCAENIIPYLNKMKKSIVNIASKNIDCQTPLILQPIWKTDGKSPRLSINCFDVFVWSNLGMLKLFMYEDFENTSKITRHTRTMVWLYKMLLDYSIRGQFDGNTIIDELSFNTKNDKAFSTNGAITQPLMKCEELIKPRILRSHLKHIILGGGQLLLSPERRLDAIIYNSPDLFEEE